jgi:hypothetical protein
VHGAALGRASGRRITPSGGSRPKNGATRAGVYGPNARVVPLCRRHEAVLSRQAESVLFLVAAFLQDWLEGKPQ